MAAPELVTRLVTWVTVAEVTVVGVTTIIPITIMYVGTVRMTGAASSTASATWTASSPSTRLLNTSSSAGAHAITWAGETTWTSR